MSTENYWNEEQWEKHLLESEALIDQYQEVFQEQPERAWDDPIDLYYKAQHNIDLGPDFGPQSRIKKEVDPVVTFARDWFDDDSESQELEHLRKDLQSNSLYQQAIEFASEVLDTLNQFDVATKHENPLTKDLAHHSLRVVADIAGGHGLGYDEEGLCGNIVKNCWALGNVKRMIVLLNVLISGSLNNCRMKTLCQTAHQIAENLEERIAQLRSNVWW